jgi:predicted pyridoxine 5'-phosphate oxidase superfamily flavin-nucleotide-binding protein
MTTARLPQEIRAALDSGMPALMVTCSADGTPNVTYLSIVHRLDESHVGLSYQFFNKTRKNVLENAMVQVIVVSPGTADQYRLDLQYERTEVRPAKSQARGRGGVADRHRESSRSGRGRVSRARPAVNAEIQAEAASSPYSLVGC